MRNTIKNDDINKVLNDPSIKKNLHIISLDGNISVHFF